jgi:Chemoreceptor zinc-binding domain
MSLKDEIDKAIGAHSAWKQRLKTAIDTGKAEVTVENAGKDNVCPFGQWLYGTSIGGAKDLSAYNDVRTIHANFHKRAAEILDLALKGKKAEATALMGVAADYNKISAQLTQAMMKWQKEAAGKF